MHGDHVCANSDHWTENADTYAAVAPGNWESEPSWGSRVPEATGGSGPALSAAAAVTGRPPPYGSPGHPPSALQALIDPSVSRLLNVVRRRQTSVKRWP